MNTWFVPPIVIPGAFVLCFAIYALYQAFV
jgi:hypothetical protein